MFTSKTKTLPGFTLIELLVTISIVTAIAAILLISFGDNRVRKELEGNGRAFSAVVREAQEYALTGKKALVNTEPCRFQMTWTGTSYSIVYWYLSGGGACTQTAPFATYELKNGTAFTNPGNFFYSLPFAASSIPTVQPVLIQKSGLSHVVCVYRDGLIVDRPGGSCN